MVYDAVIAGGGIAGLTAAAYLCKYGFKIVLCEKENKTGGLVNSFDYKGFTFDGGIRAIENSGIVKPMLAQLGLRVDFLDNAVSVGIENEIIKLSSKESLQDYKNLLLKIFPENPDDIENILASIKKTMKYMDVLYGVDNPLFLDIKKDKEYLIKTILPWSLRFLFTVSKIQNFKTPIYEYLDTLSNNRSLVDMIAQHFFIKTPSFFALSYFSLYLDYMYPKGGTGTITKKLEQYIIDNNGEILKNTRICKINPMDHHLICENGEQIRYKKLIWAADLKSLYKITDIDPLCEKDKKKILEQKDLLEDLKGGDSVLTLYLTTDIDNSWYNKICSPHFFYTPSKKGLSFSDLYTRSFVPGIKLDEETDKKTIFELIRQFYELTTFEISIPVMRDRTLAPKGKTGLIISTLFDYSFVDQINKSDWYEEFKSMSAETIINILDKSIFPGIGSKVIDHFISSPLTLEKKTGNLEGAITGWSFTNNIIPVVNKTTKVAKSVNTPIPDVYQAGQWAYSPAGLPTAIMTGKLAADKVKKTAEKSPTF